MYDGTKHTVKHNLIQCRCLFGRLCANSCLKKIYKDFHYSLKTAVNNFQCFFFYCLALLSYCVWCLQSSSVHFLEQINFINIADQRSRKRHSSEMKREFERQNLH